MTLTGTPATPGTPAAASQPRLLPADRPLLRLAALAAVAGVFLLDLSLAAAGLPAGLPLASLSWLLIASAWLLPVALVAVPPIDTRSVPNGAATWFLGLFAVAVASSLWSVHPDRTVIVAALSASAFVGSMALTRHLGWRPVVRLVSLGLLAFLGVGLLRDVALGPLASSVSDVLTGQRRMSGLTSSPTELGRVASFGFLFAVVASRSARGRERYVHLAAAGVALVAELTSGTRLIALALAGLGVLALLRRRSISALAVLALAALAMVAAFTNPEGAVRVVGRPGESGSHVMEVAGRWPVWEAGVSRWEERPFLGFGWGANERVFREARIRDEVSFEAYTAHNLLLGVLIDVGIVGAGLLLGGLVALWRSVRHVTGAWFILLLVLITGITEATFVRPSVVFVALGALAAAGHHQPEGETRG